MTWNSSDYSTLEKQGGRNMTCHIVQKIRQSKLQNCSLKMMQNERKKKKKNHRTKSLQNDNGKLELKIRVSFLKDLQSLCLCVFGHLCAKKERYTFIYIHQWNTKRCGLPRHVKLCIVLTNLHQLDLYLAKIEMIRTLWFINTFCHQVTSPISLQSTLQRG